MPHSQPRPKHHRPLHQIPLVAKIHQTELITRKSYDLCSESRRQLIRRFSAACVLAEDLEGRLARGEEIDVERHALLCSTLTRLAQRIGIDRRAKNITPSLSEYLTPQEAAK